ncbi:MAG: hypothetical protein WEA56_03265 [Balneolaceae bacterium]
MNQAEPHNYDCSLTNYSLPNPALEAFTGKVNQADPRKKGGIPAGNHDYHIKLDGPLPAFSGTAVNAVNDSQP